MADELTRTNDSSQERLPVPASNAAPQQLGYLSNDFLPPEHEKRWRIILGVAAIVIGLVSFVALSAHFSNPETFGKTMAALDEKKSTVMNLVGASTGSSAAISLLPGDAGTPIAEKLVDLSSDFLIVIAAIYLEKYLLTILGYAAFRILLPLSCLLFLGAMVIWRRPAGRELLLRLSFKLTIFALAAFLVVPVSVRVSGMIENTYKASIDETIQSAEQTTEDIENSASEGESEDSSNPLSFLLQMPEELGKLTDGAKNSLNNFIEALAVMIVTSCIIPILVLLFFLWIAKLLLGIKIELPPVSPATLRRRHFHNRRV